MSERQFLLLYLSSIALLNLVLGIQGFDMCDEGWVLSGFQQIFNDPKSVQYLFLYYLSEYVGGVWNIIFGSYGIIAFRVLTAICITATSYIVYLMFRRYVNRWCIFIGMIWVFLCADYGVMVFYHDYLTTLLSVGASYCLFNALRKNDYRWIFASGTIIGINVFARLPNISLTLLILTLIPCCIYNNYSRRSMRLLAAAVAGFAAGAGMVLLMMTVSGHCGIFLQAIEDGLSATSDGQSTHNIMDMIYRYVRSYLNILICATLIALPFYAIKLTEKLHSGQTVRVCVAAVTTAACLLVLKQNAPNTIILYAVTTLWCAYILISGRYAKDYVYLALIVFINMYVIPLGSDHGIYNMGEYCIYMSGPMAAGLSWQWLRSQQVSDSRRRMPLALCAIALCAFITLRGIKSIASQCYFDEGYRWHKTYLIDNRLATTYTTKRNCEQLNPMLHELAKYVRPDDYLLCFQNIATVHFLTNTRPYLYNPWVWTYDPTNMQRKFAEAERDHGKLPVVVRDKSMLPRWYEHYPDWNNENAIENYGHKNKKITLINRFLSSHGYRLVWENDVFQILLPPVTDKGSD